MARYIDLEELERRIKEHIKPETLEEKALIEWCKDECIRQAYCMPTADVAPKSEIARLQSQVNRLKKYDKERDIALHARLIENAKTEAVREIFAEIENLAKIYTFPVVRRGVVEIEKEPFWCIEPKDLEELKKKYTEG